MTSSANQTSLNVQQLYRLTYGILNANFLHFFAISLLFFPFIFTLAVTDLTTIFDPSNIFFTKTIITSSQNLLTFKTLITLLAFISFVILPTVAGIALITYSTHQAIHNKPLTFSSTLKSLSHSYIPLLHTFITGSITLIILFLAFTLSSFAITQAIKTLGFDQDPFIFSIIINIILSYALALTIVFFIVIWGSAAAITLFESKSGFESLRQSANQSLEFRRGSFSVVCMQVLQILPTLFFSPGFENLIQKWISIFTVGAMCFHSSLMIMVYVMANTVLYAQNDVASGEDVAMMRVEGEYVRLAMDDNGYHELAEDEANGGSSYMLIMLYMLAMILVTSIVVIVLVV